MLRDSGWVIGTPIMLHAALCHTGVDPSFQFYHALLHQARELKGLIHFSLRLAHDISCSDDPYDRSNHEIRNESALGG